MYGKTHKMTDGKKSKKAIPMTIMVVTAKPKDLPKRGQRTTKHNMSKMK